MCSPDKLYLEQLRQHVQDTRSFFSNKAKAERERAVCRAFLRTIGTRFDNSEVKSPTSDPPDVVFRTARFEVREMFDPGRKRGDEWKAKETKYQSAKSVEELLEPASWPTPIELSELVPDVVAALTEKAKNYGADCRNLDALVYVNLQEKYLMPQSPIPSLDQLKAQGWRSVVLLFPPYGVVLFANEGAPEILVEKTPGQFTEWHELGSLFDEP